MSDWQPIANAPKDGTRVDLAAKTWNAHDDKFHRCRFADCYWTKGDSMMNSNAHWVNLDSGWRATHWMPVPELPSEDR